MHRPVTSPGRIEEASVRSSAHLLHQDGRAFDGAQCDGGGEGGVLTGDAVVM